MGRRGAVLCDDDFRVVTRVFCNSRATTKIFKKYYRYTKRGDKMESYKLLLKPEKTESRGWGWIVEREQVQPASYKHGRYSAISIITLNVNGLNAPFKRQIVRMN